MEYFQFIKQLNVHNTDDKQLAFTSYSKFIQALWYMIYILLLFIHDFQKETAPLHYDQTGGSAYNHFVWESSLENWNNVIIGYKK